MEHMCHNPGTGTADRHRLSRLKGEQEHMVPAAAQEALVQNWRTPVEQLNLDVMRVFFLNAREIINYFLDDGYHIAFPTHAIYTREPAEGVNIEQRRLDAYALDSRVLSAVNTDDLVEA
eukprot:4480633-Pyramimonas_sp.AAC.1